MPIKKPPASKLIHRMGQKTTGGPKHPSPVFRNTRIYGRKASPTAEARITSDFGGADVGSSRRGSSRGQTFRLERKNRKRSKKVASQMKTSKKISKKKSK